MAGGDLRITQLGKAASTAKAGVFPIVDPITDKTVQIAVQNSLGAVRANMDWQSDVTYAIGDLVLFNSLVWESLQNSNTGNIPTENTFWTNEPISLADGITDTQYATGVFTYNNSKVINNNAQLFLQTAAPFKSTDIAAEIIAGDWSGPGAAPQNFVDFIPQDPEPSQVEGRVYYDDIKKNYVFMNDRTDVRMDVGRELWVRSINKTGIGTTNGKVVYVSGASGDLPEVQLAKADSLATARVIAVFTEDVAIDDNGEATAFGLVNFVDTSAWTAGTQLYLSEITAGELTEIIPLPPNIILPVAVVLKSDVSSGILAVHIGDIDQTLNTAVNSAWTSFSGSTAETNWLKGYYTFEVPITPAGGTTMGTANLAYGARVYFVLGAASTDMVIRVSGTSHDDTTGRTASDTEDIDTSGGAIDDYFETTKNWIGQINITLQSGTGVTVCYGWATYWDNRKQRFVITSLEWTGRAGASDSGPNISLFHHSSIGWTYTGSGALLPTPIADMQTSYVTEFQFANAQYFKYKIIGFSEVVQGENSEGMVIGIDITANNAVANSNIEVQKIG